MTTTPEIQPHISQTCHDNSIAKETGIVCRRLVLSVAGAADAAAAVGVDDATGGACLGCVYRSNKSAEGEFPERASGQYESNSRSFAGMSTWSCAGADAATGSDESFATMTVEFADSPMEAGNNHQPQPVAKASVGGTISRRGTSSHSAYRSRAERCRSSHVNAATAGTRMHNCHDMGHIQASQLSAAELKIEIMFAFMSRIP
ncbi:MAG: hypothetical protein WD065_17760 [Planctomycetaceae bacterium]